MVIIICKLNIMLKKNLAVNFSLVFLFILSSLKFYQSYDYVFLQSFQLDGGNEIAVYPEVIEIHQMIKNFQLKDYKLDGDLLNGLPMQRIVEFTYPIKLNSSSPFLFLSKTIEKNDNGLLPSGCKLIEEGFRVNLYECE